jgi:hypothetical protein
MTRILAALRCVKHANLSHPDRLVTHCGDREEGESPLEKRRLSRLIAACALVFLTALGVRLLHWQDTYIEIERGNTLLTGLVLHYQTEARRIVKEERLLFPSDHDPSDARMLVHPPGHSILMAAMYGKNLSQRSYERLRLFQVLCDALACLVVFLIAAELFPMTSAVIGGLLAGLSPHLAQYSLWLSPDSLAVLPVLIAVYLVIKAIKRSYLPLVIGAGIMIGLSCWLRSNALLLAPFLGIGLLLVLERGKRLRYLLALIVTTILVISPITVRNWVVFGHFIPLSLGSGITLIEGIADYDPDGRFGMPIDDTIGAHKEAEWYGRPEYAGNLWVPDGVERDKARVARGSQIIRSNIGWFLGVVVHRAWSMLRYNDSLGDGRSYNIASIPIVSAEPAFGHKLSLPSLEDSVWSNAAVELHERGKLLSEQAMETLIDGGRLIQVTGDNSEYSNQFTSAPIPVVKFTDYLLTLQTDLERGRMVAKVTSDDHKVTLASDPMILDEKARKKEVKKAKRMSGIRSTIESGSSPRTIQMAFASGDREDVRLVISNNGTTPDMLPNVKVGQAALYRLGATPHIWSRFPRILIRGAQRNLFKTEHMVPAILIGIVLLSLGRRWRTILMLLLVPLYYLSIQSLLHTEYRYILAIHYFLFVIAAIPLYTAGSVITQFVKGVLGLAPDRSDSAAKVQRLADSR